jgi:hypothetical protein
MNNPNALRESVTGAASDASAGIGGSVWAGGLLVETTADALVDTLGVGVASALACVLAVVGVGVTGCDADELLDGVGVAGRTVDVADTEDADVGIALGERVGVGVVEVDGFGSELGIGAAATGVAQPTSG